MSILPSSRPKATREQVIAAALKEWKQSGTTASFPDMFALGIRAYFMNSMGKPGVNDRNCYDDGVFVVGPEVFASFNANVDPSRYQKGVATLAEGVHWYHPGNHGLSRPDGGYPAFRPATKDEELPVTRDGIDVPWPGVAINIHKGGYNTTSSLGCQTIHPDQWDAFYHLALMEFKKTGLQSFPYILTTGPIN
jgi:lysozyme